MSVIPSSGTGAEYRSALPAAVCPAEVAAVASGTLPRGATGADCGGLSGPGRKLAAYSWLASAAISAVPKGRSLSASTDRYSLVLMELVHSDVFEHGERVVGEDGQGRVQSHQVARDRRLVDAGEPHRQARRLLADQARLEQAHHALPLLAGAHQDDLGLAVLEGNLVRRDQRNATPRDELRAEQAHHHRRHAPVGGLAAERGNALRVGQEEARRLPHPGDQRVQVVRRRSTTERLDRLLRGHLRQQPVLGAVDEFEFLAVVESLRST